MEIEVIGQNLSQQSCSMLLLFPTLNTGSLTFIAAIVCKLFLPSRNLK